MITLETNCDEINWLNQHKLDAQLTEKKQIQRIVIGGQTGKHF